MQQVRVAVTCSLREYRVHMSKTDRHNFICFIICISVHALTLSLVQIVVTCPGVFESSMYSLMKKCEIYISWSPVLFRVNNLKAMFGHFILLKCVFNEYSSHALVAKSFSSLNYNNYTLNNRQILTMRAFCSSAVAGSCKELFSMNL